MRKVLLIPSNIEEAQISAIEFSHDLESICKSSDVCNDIYTSVCEGISNSIIHGNKEDTEKNVIFEYRIDQNKFRCLIKDYGEGFDYEKTYTYLMARPLDLILNDDHHRGLYLMNQLMDAVRYFNNGTVLYMEKIW